MRAAPITSRVACAQLQCRWGDIAQRGDVRYQRKGEMAARLDAARSPGPCCPLVHSVRDVVESVAQDHVVAPFMSNCLGRDPIFRDLATRVAYIDAAGARAVHTIKTGRGHRRTGREVSFTRRATLKADRDYVRPATTLSATLTAASREHSPRPRAQRCSASRS